MNSILKPWIEQGYMTFAYDGPSGLKVEPLAKCVGKNKSSFYHHFADLEVFTQQLLGHHIEMAKTIAEKEAACKDLDDLISVLLEHKVDLLFNRQLRVHRENPDFRACFFKTNQLTVSAILGVWATIIGLEESSYLAALVLNLSLENFYLQITDETLNEQWLKQYFNGLKTLVREFKKAGAFPQLNGTV